MADLTQTAALGRASGDRLQSLRAYLAGGAGIVRRDASLRLSYRGSLITENVGFLITFAVFHFISKLVHVPQFQTPAQYFAFAVVGIVVFGLIHSSLTIAPIVRQELVAGTYERIAVSPFGTTAATASLLVFPMLYALSVAVFQVLVAVGLFHMHLVWSTAALALPYAVAGALAFAPFALAFAACTLAFKQSPGQSMVIAAMTLVSGAYYPVALLPAWIRWTSEIQPLTPTIDLLRHVLLGFPLHESPAAIALKIGGFILVGIPAGLYLVSLAVSFGRRRGTLIEY